MKRFILALSLLACIACNALAQSTPTSQKTIKDPAEYNAYIAALNTQDPAQKAAAMEAFLAQYPQTIMKPEALEQARAAYQQAGNVQKLEQMARLILQDSPNDVQSLVLLAAIERNRGTVQSVADARAHAELGLQLLPAWNKPEGTSDADFERVKKQMRVIFNGAAGFGALQAKDYGKAKNYYTAALQAAPLTADNLQDVYQLSIADLESSPIDTTGFWYAAKAINLAGSNNAAMHSISKYAETKYKNFHGSSDGWQQIVAAASSQNSPPPEFAVKPAPTAAELAVAAVEQNDVKQLSFSDWEFILTYRDASPANRDAAEKVWQAIQTLQGNGQTRLKIAVKVISAQRNALSAAITDENQSANLADVAVALQSPVAVPPAPGALIEVVGLLVSYQLKPFQLRMERASIAPPATKNRK